MAYNTNEKFELTFSMKKVYSTNENGWTRCRVKLKKQTGYTGDSLPSEIDAFGIFLNAFPGDEFKAEVWFENSDKYGYSLKINDPELVLPCTAKELASFLKKRCSGIGIDVIKNAVDVIGTDIVSKVVNDPTLLDGLTGFTNKKKELFISVCESNLYFEQLLLFVRSLKLPAKVASKLYDKFHRTAIHYIKTNPYYLYAEGYIDFYTADKLAYEYGHIKWNDDKRLICAARAYVDSRAVSDGDTCVPYDDVIGKLNGWIIKNGAFGTNSVDERGLISATGFNVEMIVKAINTLLYKKEFVGYQCNGVNYIFKKSFYTIENQLSENIKKWIKGDNNFYVPKKEILSYLKSGWKNLSEKQIEAICKAMNNKLSVLTGGPGTGKTFTINVLTKTIKRFYPKANIMLMAPTGRAATRMQQGSEETANTIHSALRIFPSENMPEVKDDFKLDIDFVIMDEASMTDEWLFNTFFNRIDEKASILIVGDSDQLPSVNAGNVLKDIITSGKVPVTELDKIHRQEGTSNIVLNAHKLKSGEPSEIMSIDFIGYDRFKSDFTALESDNEDDCAELVVQSVVEAVNYDANIDDVIVITPMRKGILGVVELNNAIQAKLNPAVDDTSDCVYKSGMKTLRIGDRVLQTKNNYDIGVNNGTLGTIVDIGTERGKRYIDVLVDGEEEYKHFVGDDIKDLELGYCITIHKSQGSEMKYVIMPIHETQGFMLNRKLIYTAMTRAKESFLCIGSTKLFKNKSLIKEDDARLSMLADMLKK